MKTSIFIADDHPLLLKGLEELLLEKKMNVVGKASNGKDALNFITLKKPDIAILDIQMPNLTGLEVAKACQKSKLETKIIIITLHKEIDLYLKAKEYNIFGYLLKEFAIEEIENCIHSVEIGIPYFSEQIKKNMDFTSESNSILKTLAPREILVLRLISKYKTNKEIGHILFISHRTVEKHRSNIISKLNLSHETNSLSVWVQKNKHLFHSYS
jgi:DNA-binding NarL/FixJ family response regulator